MECGRSIASALVQISEDQWFKSVSNGVSQNKSLPLQVFGVAEIYQIAD